MAGQKGKGMRCGDCEHCKPNDVCNGDCLCDALDIEVSADDDTSFYGDNEPCKMFTEKE